MNKANGAHERSGHGRQVAYGRGGYNRGGQGSSGRSGYNRGGKGGPGHEQDPFTVEDGKDMVETMGTMKNQDLDLLRLKQRIQ
ncbi:hypothetical protein L3X38_024067 [Prunus dulcis]|uniref:Uncharacterized protein n=1 Tax=Prunus dulcis TaxID=3755 RepID=A0AAD4VZ33_PRUDU|nr:hypothetical protein L3X38_024067 [Prunus dulcis]